jgi:septum formation protein
VTLQSSLRPIVLASQSLFRARLLAEAGIVFEAVPARVDEIGIKQSARAAGLAAAEAALLLAEAKAQRVTLRHPDAVVIGADQLLVCQGIWYDKPPDLVTARSHLLALRGQTHVLETAIVCFMAGQRIWHHVARPQLTMRHFSDDFVDAYLGHEGEVLTTTVGAYRLEGAGIHLFDRIEGEHSAIIGLPLLPLFGFLRQHGILLG